MASYQFLNQPNDSPSSYSTKYSRIRRGFSKSQTCLQKILQIIASHPPPPPSTEVDQPHHQFEGVRGLGIDLNMGLSDERESESNPSSLEFVNVADVFTTAEKSFSSDQGDTQFSPESQNAVGGPKNHQEGGAGDDDPGVDAIRTVPPRDQDEKPLEAKNDCLCLLIEAAETVDEVNNTTTEAAAAEEEEEEEETPSRAARSKRKRRRQVLPYRYRDSVLLLESPKRGRLPCPQRPKKYSNSRKRKSR